MYLSKITHLFSYIIYIFVSTIYFDCRAINRCHHKSKQRKLVCYYITITYIKSEISFLHKRFMCHSVHNTVGAVPLISFLFYNFLVNWKLRVSRISVINGDISYYFYQSRKRCNVQVVSVSVASVRTSQKTQSLRIITAKYLNEVCIIFV